MNSETCRRARVGLAIYFVGVVIAAAICQTLLLRTHDRIEKHVGLVLLLMWSPFAASIIARVALRSGFRDVSFRLGGRSGLRTAFIAWIYPVLVGFIAYGIAWMTGLAHFAPRAFHAFGLHVSAGPAAFFVRLVFSLTIAVPLSAISAAGEELGWRGYMLTRLIEAGVPRPVLVSGLIWGAWHVPLILSGQYAAGPHPMLSAAMFMLSILPAAFVHGYVRLASGSVWPAIVAHSTWNSVIQGPFDGSTAGATTIWVGESGILVVIASALVASVLLWRTWQYYREPGVEITAPRT